MKDRDKEPAEKDKDSFVLIPNWPPGRGEPAPKGEDSYVKVPNWPPRRRQDRKE